MYNITLEYTFIFILLYNYHQLHYNYQHHDYLILAREKERGL